MYRECRLCHRNCGVDRTVGERGRCKMTSEIYVARIAPHMWEEPPISGERGSGTVFFAGCSLGCIYCQNKEISRGELGSIYTEEELSDAMIKLAGEGVHNINFVTPTHYAPSVKKSVEIARNKGLALPIVYNTGSYDTVETVRMLKDTVDIWLPDLKYYKSSTAEKYSSAPDLANAAREAIDEMVKLCPEPIIDSEGIMQKGVIVRILLLPMHIAEAKLNLKYLYEKYGDSIYISLMSQYTPSEGLPPPLDRRVTRAEYEELIEYAERLGVKNAFIQEHSSASESFIPDFNIYSDKKGKK